MDNNKTSILVFQETESVTTATKFASYSSCVYCMLFGMLAVWQTRRCLEALDQAAAEFDARVHDEGAVDIPVDPRAAEPTAGERKQQELQKIKDLRMNHLFYGVNGLFIASLLVLAVYSNQH